MLREVVDYLNPKPGKRYLDGTLGGGGHSEQILIESEPDGLVLGLDRDDEALSAAYQRLQRFGARLSGRQASFAEAGEILATIGWQSVDGVILDLGISSHQIDSPERGFSFRGDGRLDMRMDRRQELDAERVVNTYSEAELERIFRDYGEEPQARRIARAIVYQRQVEPITTGQQLANVVAAAASVPPRGRRHLHPATRVFQALRIAVNRELETLPVALAAAVETLRTGGRLTVISYRAARPR